MLRVQYLSSVLLSQLFVLFITQPTFPFRRCRNPSTAFRQWCLIQKGKVTDSYDSTGCRCRNPKIRWDATKVTTRKSLSVSASSSTSSSSSSKMCVSSYSSGHDMKNAGLSTPQPRRRGRQKHHGGIRFLGDGSLSPPPPPDTHKSQTDTDFDQPQEFGRVRAGCFDKSSRNRPFQFQECSKTIKI